ncbi:MAG: RagB/SusD family nutrient uptake outer membrane protein, partial [Ferruginibacter sp.]
EALGIPRSPVADVYKLIIDDLKSAISKLPPTYPVSNKGKVTLDAAKAMLALVYLTKSGPTYGIDGPGLGSNEFALAGTLLDEIITGNRYSLLPSYANVFSYTNENNAEILFDIQSINTGTSANTGLGTELPSAMYEGAYANAVNIGFAGGVDNDAQKVPAKSLLASFEPADIRDDFSILPSYVDQNGNLQNRAQFVKFLDLTKRPLIRFNFPINFPILRFADVLLMKAEAILRGGIGTQAEADLLVKLVRDRAGLTGSVLTNVTLDQLLIERQHEFMAEGKRWHDLVRTGQVLIVMAATDAIDDAANKQNIPTKDDIIYPIPQTQLSVSPGLYTQNTGY